MIKIYEVLQSVKLSCFSRIVELDFVVKHRNNGQYVHKIQVKQLVPVHFLINFSIYISTYTCQKILMRIGHYLRVVMYLHCNFLLTYTPHSHSFSPSCANSEIPTDWELSYILKGETTACWCKNFSSSSLLTCEQTISIDWCLVRRSPVKILGQQLQQYEKLCYYNASTVNDIKHIYDVLLFSNTVSFWCLFMVGYSLCGSVSTIPYKFSFSWTETNYSSVWLLQLQAGPACMQVDGLAVTDF